MSGLLFGSVTSLFFVPMFYVWLDDLNVWRQRIRLGLAARTGQKGTFPLIRPGSRRVP